MTAAAKCPCECTEHHARGCNGAVPHTLHICRNPKCPVSHGGVSHGTDARRHGREFYVPT